MEKDGNGVSVSSCIVAVDVFYPPQRGRLSGPLKYLLAVTKCPSPAFRKTGGLMLDRMSDCPFCCKCEDDDV